MSAHCVIKILLSGLVAASLVGCATPAPRAQVSATLKVEISDSPLALRFTNSGSEPMQILKPLDGSESCWIMPYYKLIVTDMRGKEIRRSARCGMMDLWEGTKWPDDYLVTILPGGSYSRLLRPNHDLPASGTYKLCFHYIFEPATKWVFGKRYPKDLWRGETSSNIIETHLDEVKQE